MRLSLPMVSLCAMATRDHKALNNAVGKCLQQCDFADAIVFTDKPDEFHDTPGLRIIPVHAFDTWEDVSVWAMTVFPGYHNTFNGSHILGVHWDGYIVNPEAWSDEFLEYDYIGAPWPDNVVGNDGFTLQSVRFLQEVYRLNICPSIETCHPHDSKLMRNDNGGYRSILESKGMKIAPYEVASRFSVENKPYEGQFGFHGITCLMDVFKKGIA